MSKDQFFILTFLAAIAAMLVALITFPLMAFQGMEIPWKVFGITVIITYVIMLIIACISNAIIFIYNKYA